MQSSLQKCYCVLLGSKTIILHQDSDLGNWNQNKMVSASKIYPYTDREKKY